MSITQLLSDLAAAGIKISVADGQLKLRAPKGSMTKELRDRLTANKQALLELLSEEQAERDLSVLPQIVPDVAARHKPFPLTDIQQAYWIGSQSDMDFGDFGIHIYTEIDCTDLDFERFTHAVRRTIERHDMLRAVVDREGQQRILAEVPDYEPPMQDLRAMDQQDTDDQLEAWRKRLSHSHRDSSVWPGFEIAASMVDERHTRLHFSIDLLHIDGGSLQLLFRDLVAYYEDNQAQLPELLLSYRDYVLAEQSLHETDMYKRSLEYWRARLPELPGAPQLPTVPQEEDAVVQFRHDSAIVPEEDWSRIKVQIKRLGFSPPAVLLTAFSEALATWSMESDLTVNVTVFNRLPVHGQVGEILGDFTSMVLLGMKHDPQDTFVTRVKRVQEHLWGAFEHRHVSGVRVLRELARVRGSAQAAMMPIVFTSFLNLEDDGSSVPSSAMRALGDINFSQTQTPQVWLDHQVIEDAGMLLLSYDQMENIFPTGMIPALFDGYRRLLSQLSEPSAWERVPMGLIAEEDIKLRTLVNQTQQPIPAGTLYDLFSAQVEADPGKLALITANHRLTYGEVASRANRLGHWLQKHGAGPDKLVAVVMEKGHEQILAVMGILAAGAAYLPVDPDLPGERLSHILRDGEVSLVLTQSKLERHLDFGVGLTVLALDVEHETEGLPETKPESSATQASLAYVLYTSGSTGQPKGVMIEHRSVINRMTDVAQRWNIGPGDRAIGVSALHHDLSVFDLFGVLCSGAALVLPRATLRLDPAHWADLMRREDVTLWNSVPTFLSMLVDYFEGLPEQECLAVAPEKLRWVILAGDWIPVNLPSRIRSLVSDVTFIASGGPTETTVWDIFNPVDTVDPSWASIPYGKPLGNAQYAILDDNLQPCPTWVPGEMYISGAGLARGYWKNEEASKTFFRHPQTGERTYRSGDLGRWLPDGNIEIMGRKDFQVKIRGMRIELGEIETAVSRHPAVKRSVVNMAGERFGNQRLVGYVVREEGATESWEQLEEELRAYLNEKLPPYMVPAVFMELAQLPMGATGKVDRKALPTPESAAQKAGAFVAPRNDLETQLAEIWGEALGLEELSVETNLIDQGLNSLMAIQVNGKLRERFGYELPLRLLLDAPTIAGLARALEEIRAEEGQGNTELPQLTPDPASAAEPFQLNPIQQAYWMGRIDTFELGGVAAQYYLEFEIPPVDMERVNRAWNAVIVRHPMLRAVVRSDGRQQIAAEIPTYNIELLDMRGWSYEDAEAKRDEIRERMAHQVLDPSQWPLFEFRATQVRDEIVRFHFHLDLLVADAWSAQIVFSDFRRFMETDDTAPPMELTFRDYLLVDASLEDSQLVAASRDYWFSRLDSLPGAPTLPLAKNPGSLDKPRFVRRSFRLPSDIWATLKSRATEAGLTPSGLLLTAFGEVLANWSRVPHLCVNVTTFRRLPLHSEVNAIVGDFTSLTLLEVDCRERAIFEERARTIQERLFQDLDHRYFSGVEVVRELANHQGRQPGALMPVVFTSLLTRYEDEAAEGAEAPPVDEVFALSQTPQVWLDHQVIEEGGALVANWDAVEELFPEGLLDQMLAAYKGLLTQLARDHQLWQQEAFANLPSVQVDERIAYNQTHLELPVVDLYAMFATTAAAAPDSMAVITEDESFSYVQMHRRANRVSRWLQEQQVGSGEMVAIITNKGWQQVVGVLGILGAGAAYLPIDPQWPEDRRNYVMDHAGAKIILTQSALEDPLNWPEGKRRLSVDSEALRHLSDAPVTVDIRKDQLAYAIFTSGSTGRPKGVSITHEAAANTIMDINRRFAIGAQDRVLALSSLTFDLSVYDLFGTFAAGGAMVIPKPGSSRDPEHWLAMMGKGNVTLWNSVPALLELLVDYTTKDDGSLPGALRLAMLSGDWLPLDIADRLRRHERDARVISLGGATEASIWSIFYEIGVVDLEWKSIPYGRPLANQRFYVLDGNHHPCPQWVPGELYIAGKGLARDYLGDPEKTAASFITYQGAEVPGGPKPGERLYRTGDWGRFQPGNTIEFLGREDQQVKIQGFRIELGEVEHALLACEGVASAVALVLGDSRENRRLVAACVPEADQVLEAEVLRARAGSRLPDYMVPSSVVVLDHLPLTANGKVDRKALTQLGFLDTQNEGRVAPRTPIEIEVGHLWSELLDVTELDVNTTLFEAGGNSLVAIRMLAALQETFEVDVSLQSLFEAPTIAGLTEVIGRLKAGAGESGKTTSDAMELELVPLPEDLGKPFPLSDIQQAYLLGRLDNLELGGVAAHAYFEIDVTNGDPQRIQQVWRRLIERHDMLRAIFKGGQQIILQDLPPFELSIEDYRENTEEVRQQALDAVRGELSHQVLPTDQWPLFDLRVSLLPEDRMRLHISFDLLIADAWSSQILFTEMGILARNPDIALPPLEISFRDYMQSLEGMEQTELYQRSKTYWQERVPHLPAAPELPLLIDPATMAAPVFKRFAASLEAETWASLQERAAGAGITASGLCLAVYAEVLAAWSALPQFTINVTTFNRLPLHPNVQHLVGDFTSLTLLAVDAAERGNFQIRARTLQERLWEDLDHRHYSGVQVVRDLAQSLGRAPGALMPVVFTSRLFSGDSGVDEGADANPLKGADWVYSISQTPQVWLDMQVSQEGDGSLAWTWDAVEALFPEGVLEAMFDGYLTILQTLASDESWWERESLPLLPDAQAEAYTEANCTTAAFAPMNLYNLVAPQLTAQATEPAVITSRETLTYEDVDILSAKVAGWLASHGVQSDERVAILMEKGWEQIVAALGVVQSAAAYVPIDPQWPQDRIELLLADADVRLVLTQPDVSVTWPEGVTILPLTRENLETQEAASERGTAHPNDLAYVIFTSGTTGRPKGVAIEHGAAANTLQDINQRFDISTKDRVLGLSALTFDLSVFDVFGTLAAGAAIVLPDPEHRREPAAWAELMNAHSVSVWNSVPALLDMFLTHADNASGSVPDSMRIALLSGDWLPLDIAERLQGHQSGASVISLGGATEASIWSIYYPVNERMEGWSSVPYGTPLANQQFHVLDARLQPCPMWVAGDLYIGGVGLAREYLGDVDKTRKAFSVHPETGERLYRTGDRGRWRPEGLIEFLGRVDTQVKVQGYRIELGEIEAVLGNHPEVGGVLVEALGDPKGNRRLVAYVVPARDEDGRVADPSMNDLKEHLSAHVPSYMVPAAIMFLDTFPLSPNGKVDRKALPKPDQGDLDTGDTTAARTPVERELASLWCEMLNLERVGIHDDLFELGANSLIAIRMAAAVKERLGVELELRTLFEKATIAQVAEVVAHQRAEGTNEAVADDLVLTPDPENRYQPFPLNEVQQAYLLGRQDAMELGSIAAHSYTELDSDTLDAGRLQAIWRRLIEHHDMLRAVMGEDGQQRVLPYADLPLFEIPVQDLRDLSQEERDQKLQAWRDELSHQVLPTNQWPLFDIRVSRLGGNKIRIHYSFDLLISDAWSSQLLTLQFAYLYAQPDVRMEPLEIGFRDYVLAMDRKEHSARYRKDRNYWRRRLDSLPGAPELPLAVDPATVGQPNFVRRHAHLEADDWQALRDRCASLGVTPSGLLMAAYAEVLGAWSRTPKFCLNVTTFNRMPLHKQINDVVGDFTSLTLLEVDTAAPDATFALRARQVQEQLWVDLDHRSYSGVEVIRDLSRAKGQAPSALMPVVFTSRLFHDPRVAALEEEDFAYGEVVYSVSQTPQVWIDAQVLEEGGRLIWSWDTVDELFPVGMLTDLFDTHTQLLERLARDASLWEQHHLEITPQAHLDVYKTANDTTFDLGPAAQGTMDQLVAATVARTPDELAVVDPRRNLTYAKLWQASCALAHELRQKGVEPNQLVAIIMDKGWEQAVAALGIQLAGGAYLPISPSWPEQRVDRVLEQGEVELVVGCADLNQDAVWTDEVTVHILNESILEAETNEPPEATAGANDLAYVIFTSGSTGMPKGVAIEHAAAINTLLDVNRRYEVTAQDRVLALSELTFDLSVFDLFGIWAAGGCTIIPPAESRRDPSMWGTLGERHGVTLWNSVPALLDMMLTYGENNPGSLPPKLRLAMLSGDWLPVDIADRLEALKPGARVVSMGGATEAAIWSIFFPVPVPAPAWPSVPYGKPLANQSFHVLDEQLRPRPLHVPGELFIGGVGVAREYFGDPERTAASYITHPRTGDRLYRTGDMGKYLADGNIEFLGREDNQVKVQGFRIELGEIEAALARHPWLIAAVAAAPQIGESRERRLVAYLVPRPGLDAPDADEMRAFLGKHVPEYMVPSTFVNLESLPLTPNGKVDRKALPDPSGAVEVSQQAARTPAEERLCVIWADLLGLESVGIDDNLFDLGGTSVMAIQLVNIIRDEFGMELTMRTLFENLTVRALSLAMAQARAGGSAKMVSELPTIVPDPANRHEPFPLNDIQQAYWVGRLGAFTMGSLGAHYYVEVDSEGLDLDGFTRAFRECINRHDALRLVFLPDGTQKILKDVEPYQVVVEDLRECDEATRHERLMVTRERLSHQVLPADKWPLFEVCATYMDARTTRLHLSFDLLLADAWSFQLLFRDMATLASNPDKELETLELSFRDYVMGERHIAETDLYRQSEDYWMKRIDTLPGAPALPVRDASSLENPRFERFDCGLSAPDWERFQATASSAGVTTTGALMGAFAQVLATWSKDPRFCLNVTMFNRQPLHPQVNMILGDFTSMTLVEVDTRPSGDDDNFALQARRIQERLWTDLDHGHFGGVKVLREMARKEGGAGAVTMPVVFTSRLFKIAGFDTQTASGDRIGEVVYSISQTPQVWIDHQLTEKDGALCLNWDVVADLFPKGMMDDMFAAYQRLLDFLAEDSENWSRPLPMLVPQSQVKQLAAHHQQQVSPQQIPAQVQFARLAQASPQATALVADGVDGEMRLSYGELNARAAAISSWLKAQNLEAGQSVAVILQRGWEKVAAILGILDAGGSVMPLGTDYPMGMMKSALVLTRTAHVLSHSSRIEGLGLGPDIATLAVDRITATDGRMSVEAAHDAWSAPAYISGSLSGDGKLMGVVQNHETLATQMQAVNQRFGLTETDRCLVVADAASDRSLFQILSPLLAGARLILPKPGQEGRGSYLRELTSSQKATIFSAEPGHLSALLADPAETGLRLCLISGEGAPLILHERAQSLGQTRLAQLSGAVESGPWALCFDGDTIPSDCMTLPLGQPMANHTAVILDAHGHPRPAWVPGELFIGGPGLALGYVNDPRREAANFKEMPDPLGSDQHVRLFGTGVLCRYTDDGTIELLDWTSRVVARRRAYDQFTDMEALLNHHEGVAQSAVAALPGPDGQRRIVAYVARKQEGVPGAEAPGAPPAMQAPDGAPPAMPEMPEAPALDALFRSLQFDPIYTPLERLEFKMAKHAVRRDLEERPVFDLALPEDRDTELAAFTQRRSHRRFLNEPLGLNDLGQLMELLRVIQPKGVLLPKYRYPSGGGLYPVMVYMAVEPGQINGLDGGIYYYQPAEHVLHKLSDETVPKHWHAPENAAIVKNTAFTLFFIGRLTAVSPLYLDRGRDFCYLEAGYMSQLMMQEAPDNIGLCPLGGMAFDPIREHFQLEDTDLLVHVLVGGSVSTEKRELAEAFLAEQLDARDFEEMTKEKAVVTDGGDTNNDGPNWQMKPFEEPDWKQQAIFDPITRLQFKMEKKGIRKDLTDGIALPASDLEVLEPIYARRRSYRHFLQQGIPLATFGQWLATLRCVQPEGMPLPKYRYPSGGGLYPVQTYLHLKEGAVQGLEKGVYYYEPHTHKLHLIEAGIDLPNALQGPPNRPIETEASFSLMFVGKYGAVAPLYPALARDFCLLESGYMGQLLEDTSLEHGVGLIPLGGMDFDGIRPHFHLDDDCDLVHVFLGGPVSTEPVGLKQVFAEQNKPFGTQQVEAADLEQILSRRLPQSLVPKHFVFLDKLPKSPFGGVDRAALPDPDLALTPEELVAPESEAERKAAEVWCEILGLEQVGIDQNFFEIGGTSVQMVQLHGRLQDVFSKTFPLVDLFEHPTVRTQAQYFEAANEAFDMQQAKDQAAKRKAARRRRRR